MAAGTCEACGRDTHVEFVEDGPNWGRWLCLECPESRLPPRGILGTDAGPECDCGGTIYSYRIGREVNMVTARCVGCGKARVLYLDLRGRTIDAKTIRAHHVRANKAGV